MTNLYDQLFNGTKPELPESVRKQWEQEDEAALAQLKAMSDEEYLAEYKRVMGTK